MMKRVFLLSVCVATLNVNFGRVPAAQRDQEVIKNLADIKRAITKIENCLSGESNVDDVSDVDFPINAQASDSDSEGRNSLNKGTIRRVLSKFKPKPLPVSTDPANVVVLGKDQYLASDKPLKESGSEASVSSNTIDELVSSIYSKAIQELKVSSSIELTEDEGSLPELAKLSLRIQIIMDPQQVIYDDLASKSLQVGLSSASREKLVSAEGKNKELIDEYSKLLTTKKGKKYIEHLKNTMITVKAKANEGITDLLYGDEMENTKGYYLTSFGFMLINSLSDLLAKNGIFRQYLVNEKGAPILLDKGVEYESIQDNVVVYMTALLSNAVLHQMDLRSACFVFSGTVFKESNIDIPKSADTLYMLNNKSVRMAQWKKQDSSFEADTHNDSIHALTDSDNKTLKMVALTLIRKALRDSKLRSTVFQPLM